MGDHALQHFLMTASLGEIRNRMQQLHAGKKPSRCGMYNEETRELGACSQCVDFMRTLVKASKKRAKLKSLYRFSGTISGELTKSGRWL